MGYWVCFGLAIIILAVGWAMWLIVKLPDDWDDYHE